MADKWESLTVSEIVPGFIPVLGSAVSATITPISTILTTAASLMGTAKAFLIDITDPITAIVDAVIKQITNETNEFFNTGVYFTYVVPKTLADKKGLKSTLRKITNTFHNDRDPKRPQFTESESCGAYVLAVGGSSLVDMKEAAKLLKLILDIKEIEEFLDLDNPVYRPEETPFPNGAGMVTSLVDGMNPREVFMDLGQTEQTSRFTFCRMKFLTGLNKDLTTRVVNFDKETRQFQISPLPRNLQVGDTYQILFPQGGKPPNWYSKRVAEIFPPLGTIFAILQSLTNLLAAGNSIVKAADDFITALQNKALGLDKIAKGLQTRIDELVEALQGSGISILRLSPQSGGVDGLAARVLEAGDAPEWEDRTHYTICAMMVADDASYSVLEKIFG